MLDSAERQPWIGRDHCIDEDHAGVQLGYEKLLFFTIVRPRAGAETERSVVRELDRAVGIPHPENSCNWAENFFAIGR